MAQEGIIRVTILIILAGLAGSFLGCFPGPDKGPTLITKVEEYDVGSDTVTVKASMPAYSDGGSAAALSGQIYVIGGYYSGDAIEAVLKYDIASDVWTQVARIPIAPGYGAAVCSADGKIYAIGGNAGDAATQQYDPIADVWTRKANMQYGRGWAAVAVDDGKIYVFGGGSPPNTVECYDPATDTWSLRADMPTGRSGAVAEVLNGKIYVIGGYWPPTGTTEEYNPATDTWAARADMPGDYGHGPAPHPCVTANGKIYVVCYPTPSPGVITVNEYDPVTDSWQQWQTTRIMWRREFCYASANGKLYIMGGFLPP